MPEPRVNLDLERHVLACVFHDNAQLPAVRDLLTAEAFVVKEHREIYAAMCELAEEGSPIDMTILTDHLGLQAAAKLSEAFDGTYRVPNVESYAKRLAKEAARRRLAQLGAELQEKAIDGEDTSVTLAAIAEITPPRGFGTEKEIRKEMSRQRIRQEAQRRLRAADRGRTTIPEILTLRDRLALPHADEPAWTLPRWQPQGSRVVLAAQYKSGKTTFTGNVVRCLVDGDDFLGEATVSQIDGTVFVVDFEMASPQLDRWMADQGIRNDHRVILLPMRGQAATFDIVDDRVRAEWATLLREHQCQYLIIDCLRPILDALDLDEKDEAGRFLEPLDALLLSAEVPDCLLVHHMGHNGERTRGDSRLRDWPDVEWRLIRQNDDPRSPRFITAYGRDVDIPETQLAFDSDTRHLTIVGGSRHDAREQQALDAIVVFLRETDNKPLSVRGAQDALDGKVSRDDVRRGLKRGRNDGTLIAERGAKNALLHRVCERVAARGHRAAHSAGVCAAAYIKPHTRTHTDATPDESLEPHTDLPLSAPDIGASPRPVDQEGEL